MTGDESEDTGGIDQLPSAYAEALRLRATGLTWHEIGRRLGIEPEAVDTLLHLAEAKLATARALH
jgi:DNA-directed RNA polymerase specialized sigma24 family protein